MKTYEVIDNSQQICFETDRNEYLAGTVSNDVKTTVKVIVKPFDREYTFLGKKYTHKFIIGKCPKGKHHLIIYHG